MDIRYSCNQRDFKRYQYDRHDRRPLHIEFELSFQSNLLSVFLLFFHDYPLICEFRLFNI